MVKRSLKGLLTAGALTIAAGTQAFAEGENSKGGFSYWYLVLALAVLVVGYILYSRNVGKKIDAKEDEVSDALYEISQHDASWDEDSLLTLVDDVFYKVRGDLAQGNTERLKKLLHPSLFEKWSEQLSQTGPVDGADNVNIEEVSIADVKNYTDDEKDTFVASVTFTGPEYTTDKHGNIIDTQLPGDEEAANEGYFTEYWTFEREGQEWMLLNVSRDSNWKKIIGSKIINEE